MRTTLALILACTCVIAAVALPEWERPRDPEPAVESALAGVPLAVNVQSSRPCHLIVECGPDTVSDRGPVSKLEPRHAFRGTFRYWEEAGGRVLYVYDDAQNLVGRVRNPASVRLVDLVE